MVREGPIQLRKIAGKLWENCGKLWENWTATPCCPRASPQGPSPRARGLSGGAQVLSLLPPSGPTPLHPSPPAPSGPLLPTLAPSTLWLWLWGASLVCSSASASEDWVVSIASSSSPAPLPALVVPHRG